MWQSFSISGVGPQPPCSRSPLRTVTNWAETWFSVSGAWFLVGPRPGSVRGPSSARLSVVFPSRLDCAVEMLFADVIQRLEAALQRELPGAAAQDVLAPVPRREWPAGFNPARARHAAALVLVFPVRDHAHIVLTVRSDTLGRHSGQVSLPGGGVEPGETFEQAALREAREEIALPLEGVTVLGALTPLDIPVSGFRLHPIVAVRSEQPTLTPADGEVARILEVPLADLADAAALRSTRRQRDGQPIAVPAFHVHGAEIWGATAMVLAELLALLGWRPARTT